MIWWRDRYKDILFAKFTGISLEYIKEMNRKNFHRISETLIPYFLTLTQHKIFWIKESEGKTWIQIDWTIGQMLIMRKNNNHIEKEEEKH